MSGEVRARPLAVAGGMTPIAVGGVVGGGTIFPRMIVSFCSVGGVMMGFAAVVDGDGVVACCVFPVPRPGGGGGHAFALLVDRGAFHDLWGGWGVGWAGLEMLLMLF